MTTEMELMEIEEAEDAELLDELVAVLAALDDVAGYAETVVSPTLWRMIAEEILPHRVDEVLAALKTECARRAAQAQARELYACKTLIKQTPGAHTLADVLAQLGCAETHRRLDVLRYDWDLLEGVAT